MERRKDSKGRVMKEGESERANGTYMFRYREDGKRYSVYAKTLQELREKEQEIASNAAKGVSSAKRLTTLNFMYEKWKVLAEKRISTHTLVTYENLYECHVRQDLGLRAVSRITKMDMILFYNRLDEIGLKIASIELIGTVIKQIFDLAIEENAILKNPCIGAIKEMKKDGKQKTVRNSLTIEQQKLFEKYLTYYENLKYQPLFTILLGTGMRISECLGLRWEDVDLENRTVDVNHSLIYIASKKTNKKTEYVIVPPKTRNGYRTIPMTDKVYAAFLEESERHKRMKIKPQVVLDAEGKEYGNFIFTNENGGITNLSYVNNALKRIIEQGNARELAEGNELVVPEITCHYLRHTFTTRAIESNMDVKTLQSILGHGNIQMTLDVYADVTQQTKQLKIDALNDYMNNL